jgi:hypothetical protein
MAPIQVKNMRFTALAISLLILVSACKQSADDTSSAAITPSTAMCAKDTDCKGDRICDSGVCKQPNVLGSSEPKSHASAKVSVTIPTPAVADPGSDAECVAGKNDALEVGAAYNDGLYLCREPIDGGYWNDWYMVPAPSAGATFQVKSDGKAGAFEGKLKIDCLSGQVKWSNAINFDAPVDTDVPSLVVTNAKKIACRA